MQGDLPERAVSVAETVTTLFCLARDLAGSARSEDMLTNAAFGARLLENKDQKLY